MNQSVGGAKTGVPGEKPPDTPASRTWLVSHMNLCPVRGANHPRVMIYTNFVDLHSLMLHDKFENHRLSGSGEDF